MWRLVDLYYFRPITGRLLGRAEARVELQTDTNEAIWEEIHELRRIGRLPGLRPNAGRDLIILVVGPEPDRVLHLVMPPSIEEEDNTPVRVPTGEMNISRTSTQDFIRPPDEPDKG